MFVKVEWCCILNEFKFQNVDELHIAIGSNKITLGQVINLVFNETTSKQEIILKKVQNNTNVKNKINNIEIVGAIAGRSTENILLNLDAPSILAAS